METLLIAPIYTGNTHRDTFYVKKEGNRYYIGHYHGETRNVHEVRVSEEFYNAFILEKQRIKEKFGL